MKHALKLAAVCALFIGAAGSSEIARAQCGPGEVSVCSPISPLLDCCVEIDYVGSYDPNDKIGLDGYGALRSVARAAFLPYTIHFENLPAATAPAQEVVVTDVLDPNLFDLTTFTFTGFGFGDRSLPVPIGQKSVAVDVDLRPSQELIVRFEASIQSNTGAITCRFRSLDPLTLDPIDDPLGGFLPPNTAPPAGEGFVSFAAQAKAALATGTRIPNMARIVFDVNAPIDTPEWFNTVDADMPASQVDPLPPMAMRRDFGVSWGGNDAGSGVRDYTIFVSDNNGPYEPWLQTTTALADTFPGEHGHSYRFYAVARDSVGNLELAPGQPDATTYLDTTTAALPTLVDAQSDGGVVRVLWYAAEAAGDLVVERRRESSNWEPAGAPSALGRDLFEFRDADVVAGERYGYRLVVPRNGRPEAFGEVWVRVGQTLQFALFGAHPNPCRNPVVIEYAIPREGDAVLELFDVRGRRILARHLTALGSGLHHYSLAEAGPLQAGGYIVRIRYEDRSLTRKLVVMP